MKKRNFLFGFLLFAVSACGTAENHSSHTQSAYKGEESRLIKSLSETQVNDYLNGRGMGLAKAAELNNFPGPMHVLELESKLNLSSEQKAAVQNSFQKMKDSAVNVGNNIVEKEKELNQLFAENKIDSALLENKTREIANLQGELRRVHLQAHLDMKQILSAEQVENYNRLRGYEK